MLEPSDEVGMEASAVPPSRRAMPVVVSTPRLSSRGRPGEQRRLSNGQSPRKLAPYPWELRAHPEAPSEFYYYNTVTGQGTWELPPGVGETCASVDEFRKYQGGCDDEPRNPWRAVEHANVPGEWYYVNEDTGETRWELPEEFEESDCSESDGGASSDSCPEAEEEAEDGGFGANAPPHGGPAHAASHAPQPRSRMVPPVPLGQQRVGQQSARTTPRGDAALQQGTPRAAAPRPAQQESRRSLGSQSPQYVALSELLQQQQGDDPSEVGVAECIEATPRIPHRTTARDDGGSKGEQWTSPRLAHKCANGCGFRAGAGLRYCCRGCEGGQGHDEQCERLAPVPLDMRSPRTPRTPRISGRGSRRVRQSWSGMMDQLIGGDSVWGTVPLGENGKAPRLRRALFPCCPCWFVGLDSEGRLKWKTFLLSFSVLFAVVQLLAMLALVALFGVRPLDENLLIGPDDHAFNAAGAKNVARILQYGEWWRLFTALFIHGGWLHLITNLVVQLRISVGLEVIWGRWIWLAIYVVSGVFSNLLSCVLHPGDLGVGSSGALCGLVGAWMGFLLLTWTEVSSNEKNVRFIQTAGVMLAAIIILATSFLPNMDAGAHIGGLCIGLALAMVFFASKLKMRTWRIFTLSLGLLFSLGMVGSTLWWVLRVVEPAEDLLAL